MRDSIGIASQIDVGKIYILFLKINLPIYLEMFHNILNLNDIEMISASLDLI